MNIFDMRTIILYGVFTEIISTVIVLTLWVQTRRRYRGTGFFAVSFVFYLVSWILVLLRGYLPDFFSMVAANTLAVTGNLLGYIGFEYFVEKRGRQVHNILILMIFPLVHSYFLYVKPDLTARSLNFAVTLTILLLQYLLLIYYRTGPGIRRYTGTIGVIMILLSAVCCGRLLQLVLFPSRYNEHFATGFADALFMIGLQMLLILLAYSLVLMVNRRLVENILEEEEKFSKAFYSSPYAMLLTRLNDGKVLEVNEGFTRTTGYRPDEVLGKSTLNLAFWGKQEDRAEVISEISINGNVQWKEIPFRKKSGEIFIGHFSAEIIKVLDEDCLLSSINDITERVRAEEQIRYMANHDALTDLPSLRLARDRISMAVSHARRNKTKVALMFIDLDGFKIVNDSFGHEAGNVVLRQIARRLLRSVRETDTVARVGGDEFMIIATGLYDIRDAGFIADKTVQIVSQQIEIDGRQANVGASIGISLFPDDSEDISQLINYSDDAMYKIKKSGKNGYCFYNSSALSN